MDLTYAAATGTVTTRHWARTSGVTPQADTRIIRVWKDEKVVGVVSLGWRFLQTPCRGTVCTFGLARLPSSYTYRAYAHVTPMHIDICVLPFSPTLTLIGEGLSPGIAEAPARDRGLQRPGFDDR